MIAIPRPMPLPVNWKNARTASNRAIPAMRNREDPCPRLECPQPEGGEEPNDPGGDGEPAPQPDIVQSREVAECAEPVEPKDPQAEEQEAEAGERREETEDRDEDGRVLHVSLPTRLEAFAPASGDIVSQVSGGDDRIRTGE